MKFNDFSHPHSLSSVIGFYIWSWVYKNLKQIWSNKWDWSSDTMSSDLEKTRPSNLLLNSTEPLK